MLTKSNNKLHHLLGWVGLSILFILVGILSSLGKIEMMIVVSVGICLFMLYLLIFKREWLFQLNLLLIPLSMEVEIPGFGTINYPSEAVILFIFFIGFPFFLYNIKEYKTFIKHPISLVLLLGLMWMFITSGTSEMPMVGFKRSIIRLLYMYVYFFLTWKYIKEDVYKGLRYLLFYVIGLIIPVIISIVFMADFNFIPAASYMAGFPYFKDHTIYGASVAFVFALLLVFSFKKNQDFSKLNLKVLYIVLTSFFLVALILSFSRAAWVSIIAALIFVYCIKFNLRLNRIYFVCGILVMAIAFNWGTIYDSMKRNESESSSRDITEHAQSVTNLNKDASNMERINRWVCALKMFRNKPLTGYGPGTYQFFYGDFQTKEYMTRISTYSGNKGHAHSEYIGALAEQGILGFLFFIASVHLILVRGSVLYQKILKDKNDRNLVLAILAALMTFFVHSFFNGFMDTDKIAGLFFLSFAIIVAYDMKHKRLISLTTKNTN